MFPSMKFKEDNKPANNSDCKNYLDKKHHTNLELISTQI